MQSIAWVVFLLLFLGAVYILRPLLPSLIERLSHGKLSSVEVDLFRGRISFKIKGWEISISLGTFYPAGWTLLGLSYIKVKMRVNSSSFRKKDEQKVSQDAKSDNLHKSFGRRIVAKMCNNCGVYLGRLFVDMEIVSQEQRIVRLNLEALKITGGVGWGGLNKLLLKCGEEPSDEPNDLLSELICLEDLSVDMRTGATSQMKMDATCQMRIGDVQATIPILLVYGLLDFFSPIFSRPVAAELGVFPADLSCYCPSFEITRFKCDFMTPVGGLSLNLGGVSACPLPMEQAGIVGLQFKSKGAVTLDTLNSRIGNLSEGISVLLRRKHSENIGDLVLNVPVLDGSLNKDGWVFWIRTLSAMGSAISATKRPSKVWMRNELIRAYHAWELSGEEPDWESLPELSESVGTPLVVDVRIGRASLRASNGVKLVVVNEKSAVRIIADLVSQRTEITCKGVSIIGGKGREVVKVDLFEVFVPGSSHPRLDREEIGEHVPHLLMTGCVGGPSCGFNSCCARVPSRGPPPIAIKFSSVTLQACPELLAMAAAETFVAMADVYKWDVKREASADVNPPGTPSRILNPTVPGFIGIPSSVYYYKPVEVLVEKCRLEVKDFPPLAAVVDISKFELAVGPTKDSLSFAFEGVKAWSPGRVGDGGFLVKSQKCEIKIKVLRKSDPKKPGRKLTPPASPATPLLVNSAVFYRILTVSSPLVEVKVSPGLRAIFKVSMFLAKESVRLFTVPGETVRARPEILQTTVHLGDLVVGVVPANYRREKSHAKDDSDTPDGVWELAKLSASDIRFSSSKLSDEGFRMGLGSLRLETAGRGRILLPRLRMSAERMQKFSVQFAGADPVEVQALGSVATLAGFWEELRASGLGAWEVPRLPSISELLTVIEGGGNAETITPEPESNVASPAVNAAVVNTTPVSVEFYFRAKRGFRFTWEVPGETPPLEILLPGPVELPAVFHGYPSLDGNPLSFNTIEDAWLLDWLRKPWLEPSMLSKGVSVERRSASSMEVDDKNDVDSEDVTGHAAASFPSFPGGSLFFGVPSPKQSPQISRQYSSTADFGSDSWDSHWMVSKRVIEYLSSGGGPQSSAPWVYGTQAEDHPLKFVDTPVYGQIALVLRNARVSWGDGPPLLFSDALRLKAHIHNFPISECGTSGTDKQPPILLSWWAECTCPTGGETVRGVEGLVGGFTGEGPVGSDYSQSPLLPARPSLGVDLGSPEKILQLAFRLLGSSSEMRRRGMTAPDLQIDAHEPNSAGSTGLSGLVRKFTVLAPGELMRLFLAKVDVSFCMRLNGLGGRVGGWRWVLGEGELCRDFEGEAVGVSGFSKSAGMVVGALRRVSICHEIKFAAGRSDPHNSLCLNGAPEPSLTDLVLPFAVVENLTMTLALKTELLLLDKQDSGAEVVRIFLSAAGARMQWSPALQRCVRRSVGRSDGLVRFARLWRKSFFKDIGETAGEAVSPGSRAKLAQAILAVVDSFMLIGKRGTVTFSFADMQTNFHNPATDEVDIEESGADPVLPGSPVRRFQSKQDEIFKAFLLRRDRRLLRESTGMHCLGCSPEEQGSQDDSLYTNSSLLPPYPLVDTGPVRISSAELDLAGVEFGMFVGVEQAKDRVAQQKPRGSQLVLSAARSVFSISVDRTSGLSSGSNLRLSCRSSLRGLEGSVAPTSLRGLLWVGSGVLRPVLTITEICIAASADLFPLASAWIRILVPKTFLGADSEAFVLVMDVLQECLLYRGSVIEENGSGSARSGQLEANESASDLIKMLLEASAETDSNRTSGKRPPRLSVEYKLDQLAVHLNHRQRVLMRTTFAEFFGSHVVSLDLSKRMSTVFELKDLLIVCDERNAEKIVFKSATADGDILTVRSKDKLVIVGGREWCIYDNVLLGIAPIVLDVSQELIDELWEFLFPESPYASKEDPRAEFGGNRLLGNKVPKTTSPPAAVSKPSKPARRGRAKMHLFKYVRFAPVDSIVTYKSRRLSLNMLSVILKPYVKKRKLSTWKKFMQVWASGVGQQLVGSVVAHTFKRRKGLQEAIRERFLDKTPGAVKMLFGKYHTVATPAHR